jgi:hypothetical protein
MKIVKEKEAAGGYVWGVWWDVSVSGIRIPE